jgi:hypothetical protein
LRFVVKEPREILRRLAEYVGELKTEDISSYPWVRIYIQGHAVSGRVLKLDNASGRQCVLLLCDEEDSVAYIDIDSVVALQVRADPSLAPVLSYGAVARSPSEKAPSRLELKRELSQLPEKFQSECGLKLKFDFDWQTIPESDEINLNLRDVARALIESVKTSSSDGLGRSTWTKLAGIALHHRPQASLKAQLTQNTLEVNLDLSRALPSPLEKRLTEALNAVL